MPAGIYKRAKRDPNERFDEKYIIRKSGCWEWTGYINDGGYGTFHTSERPVLAHRFSYNRAYGEIMEGLELDHLCRNRRCVNPNHLEQVTRRENTMRGNAPQKLKLRQKMIADQRMEKCKNGHSYRETPPYMNGLRKHCRICKADSKRRIRGLL